VFSLIFTPFFWTELCVATRRPQTTRHAILGVMTQDDVQLAFTDTPGVIDNPAYKLQEGMMEAVKGALKDADIILVVTDIFSTPIPDDVMFQKIQAVCDSEDKPVIVAINKCDLLEKLSKAKATGSSPDPKENEGSAGAKAEITTKEEDVDDKTYSILDAVAKWRSLLPKAAVIIPLIAGAKDDPGVNLLRDLVCGGPDVPASIRSLGRPIDGMFQEGVKFISNEEAQALVPKGPPMYDEDTLTDRTERFFASEMIRAAIFEEFKKEVPYCTEVQVSEFKEDPNKKLIRMRATIFVERESQKGIVVGKGGLQIKKVGVRSRKSLEDFFQSKIFLDLSVKVDKDWRRKETSLKKFGYMR
jgi:GTP-binding protein Era